MVEFVVAIGYGMELLRRLSYSKIQDLSIPLRPRFKRLVLSFGHILGGKELSYFRLISRMAQVLQKTLGASFQPLSREILDVVGVSARTWDLSLS
jgi:hypothetical protein